MRNTHTETPVVDVPKVPKAHLSRLLQGMAVVVVEKAFADITVADIVRAAGVSKRSFYEHFASKEACFLALYRAASNVSLRTLQAAVVPSQPWQSQVEKGLDAYFSHLAAGQGLVRALFIDIHYLGEAGAFARRQVMQELADFLLVAANGHSVCGETTVLSPALAMAAMGGINELILQAIESDRLAHLAELTGPASVLVQLLTVSAVAEAP